MKMLKVSLSLIVTLLAFAINPMYLMGCDALGVDFDNEQMSAELVKAMRTYSLDSADGTIEMSLAIDSNALAQADVFRPTNSWSLIQEAHACSAEYSFVQPAAACMPSTYMNVPGVITITWAPRDGEPEVIVDKEEITIGYEVLGRALTNGKLYNKANGATVSYEFSLSSETGDGKDFTLQSFKHDALMIDIDADAQDNTEEMD